MPRVRTTPRARSDAIDIWAYVARDNPDAADQLVDRIEERLQSLARMPESAEAVPFIAEGVRRSSVGKYVIYYRPADDGIEVLRILHGARQPEDLL